jgi:hypothetical protein
MSAACAASGMASAEAATSERTRRFTFDPFEQAQPSGGAADGSRRAIEAMRANVWRKPPTRTQTTFDYRRAGSLV